MLRWNGWGDEKVTMNLPAEAVKLLKEFVGEGNQVPSFSFSEYLKKIPESDIPSHSLIETDSDHRLYHAHGQSLPDWVGMRMGTIKRFPDGVAFPSSMEELQAILSFARRENIVVIPHGGGTSVAGHVNIPESDRPVLTISMKRLCRMTEIDPVSLLATFEAGIFGPNIEAQLRAKGFTLGHYPQSFELSTLGGWVVTRSSGQQSSHFGRIEQLFAGGEMVTPKGVLSMPPHPASAAGPDLRQMVLGSEGRMGVLSKATVRISSLPEKDEVFGIFFPSWEQGVEALRLITDNRIPCSMARLSNPIETVTNLALGGEGGKIELLKRYLRLRNVQDYKSCMLLIGFIGTSRITSAAKNEALSIFKRLKGINIGKAMGEAWKKNRFRAPYLRNTLWDLGYAVDTLETAICWNKVTPTMNEVEKAISTGLEDKNEKVHVFSHLSHVYPTGSSIYTSYIFRIADTPEETLSRWKRIKSSASEAIVKAGGTISHQHGVGTDHAQYLEAEKGALGMSLIKQVLSHLDPDERMNPGKLIDSKKSLGPNDAE